MESFPGRTELIIAPWHYSRRLNLERDVQQALSILSGVYKLLVINVHSFILRDIYLYIRSDGPEKTCLAFASSEMDGSIDLLSGLECRLGTGHTPCFILGQIINSKTEVYYFS